MSRLIRLLVLISLPFAVALPAEGPEALWRKAVAAIEAGDDQLYRECVELLRQVDPEFRDSFSGAHITVSGVQSASRALSSVPSGASGSQVAGATEFHVVPPDYAGIGGNVTFTGPAASGARTYQLLIHDTLLTAVRGRKLTGLAWRLPSSATGPWPTADITYGNFEVFLSGSVPPANRSLTFSDNVVGPQTRVRTGSLAVQAGAYGSGGSPNEWGPEVKFTPWTYAGGHLLVEIRHTGFTGTSRSVDAAGTALPGYGSLFSALWQSSVTPTTGLQGNFSITRLTSDDSSVTSIGELPSSPSSFALFQNYPNPFNPATTIRYQIPFGTHVTLKVFDLLGREVATLVDGTREAGIHAIQLQADDLPSGMYLYRLTAGAFTETRRVVIVK